MSRLIGLVFCAALLVSFVAADFDRSAYDEPRSGFSVSERVEVVDTAVFSSGYYSVDGVAWTQFSLSGDRVEGSWVIGEATSSPVSSSARYFAVFSCSWSDEWVCSSTWQVLDRGPRESLDIIDSVEGDREALIALFESTAGGSWTTNQGWLSSQPLSEWYGIETDSEGRVVRVDLMQNNLVGTLPSALGNLKRTEWFNVKGNYLTGQLPKEIGDMTELTYLYLAGRLDIMPRLDYGSDYHPGKARAHTDTNSFDGSILPPEWGDLKNLRLLELSQTRVQGPLPPEWAGMDSIERMYLNGKRVSDGLEKGYLTGELPKEWAALTTLTALTLNDNTDFGPTVLPPEWSTLTNMRHFRVRRTNVVGEIPREWETWSNIRLFYVRSNRLTGAVPAWLLDDRTPRLTTFEMPYNNFTSMEITDPSLVTKTSPQVFSLNWNSIDAPFPSYVKQYRRMQILSLNGRSVYTNIYNTFTGPMPDDFFENWDRLRNINLAGLNIGGTLPSSFGRSSSTASTQRLYFNNAGFTGTIPESWGDYKSEGTYWLFLNGNELHGPVPVGFADWNWVVGQDGLRLNANRFTYKDVIPLLDVWPSDINILYGNQKPFPVNQTSITMSSGQTLSIDLSDTHISGNEYQWFKDEESLSGQTSHTLSISEVTSSHSGDYSLRITNSRAPELSESISESISVVVS